MERPGWQKIVDIAAGAGNKALGFFSFDAFANGRVDRKIHFVALSIHCGFANFKLDRFR
jgi:hypothetical protein